MPTYVSNEGKPQRAQYINNMIEEYKTYDSEFDLETDLLKCCSGIIEAIHNNENLAAYRIACRAVAAAELLTLDTDATM